MTARITDLTQARLSRRYAEMVGVRPIPPAHLIAFAPDVAAEAQFLCDRLRELECSFLDDEVGNEYYGHIAPSRARLEALLREARGEEEA